MKRTIFHYYLRRQETLVRQLVKNVYNEQEGFGKKNSLGKEQFLALQTEEFMKRRYEFRYNTQVGEVEYRERNSFRFYFNPIDKRVLNSIALDAQGEGIPLWDRDISRYIYSNRIPVFNPLEDFLYHLPVWNLGINKYTPYEINNKMLSYYSCGVDFVENGISYYLFI